jgi:hypothetical protein
VATTVAGVALGDFDAGKAADRDEQRRRQAFDLPAGRGSAGITRCRPDSNSSVKDGSQPPSC